MRVDEDLLLSIQKLTADQLKENAKAILARIKQIPGVENLRIESLLLQFTSKLTSLIQNFKLHNSNDEFVNTVIEIYQDILSSRLYSHFLISLAKTEMLENIQFILINAANDRIRSKVLELLCIQYENEALDFYSSKDPANLEVADRIFNLIKEYQCKIFNNDHAFKKIISFIKLYNYDWLGELFVQHLTQLSEVVTSTEDRLQVQILLIDQFLRVDKQYEPAIYHCMQASEIASQREVKEGKDELTFDLKHYQGLFSNYAGAMAASISKEKAVKSYIIAYHLGDVTALSTAALSEKDREKAMRYFSEAMHRALTNRKSDAIISVLKDIITFMKTRNLTLRYIQALGEIILSAYAKFHDANFVKYHDDVLKGLYNFMVDENLRLTFLFKLPPQQVDELIQFLMEYYPDCLSLSKQAQAFYKMQKPGMIKALDDKQKFHADIIPILESFRVLLTVKSMELTPRTSIMVILHDFSKYNGHKQADKIFKYIQLVFKNTLAEYRSMFVKKAFSMDSVNAFKEMIDAVFSVSSQFDLGIQLQKYFLKEIEAALKELIRWGWGQNLEHWLVVLEDLYEKYLITPNVFLREKLTMEFIENAQPVFNKLGRFRPTSEALIRKNSLCSVRTFLISANELKSSDIYYSSIYLLLTVPNAEKACALYNDPVLKKDNLNSVTFLENVKKEVSYLANYLLERSQEKLKQDLKYPQAFFYAKIYHRAMQQEQMLPDPHVYMWQQLHNEALKKEMCQELKLDDKKSEKWLKELNRLVKEDMQTNLDLTAGEAEQWYKRLDLLVGINQADAKKIVKKADEKLASAPPQLLALPANPVDSKQQEVKVVPPSAPPAEQKQDLPIMHAHQGELIYRGSLSHQDFISMCADILNISFVPRPAPANLALEVKIEGPQKEGVPNALIAKPVLVHPQNAHADSKRVTSTPASLLFSAQPNNAINAQLSFPANTTVAQFEEMPDAAPVHQVEGSNGVEGEGCKAENEAEPGTSALPILIN